MQGMLRELERLLTRSASTRRLDGRPAPTAEGDAGLVLLCVHQYWQRRQRSKGLNQLARFRKLLWRNRSRFSATTKHHLLEDLAELAGDSAEIKRNEGHRRDS